MFKKSEHEKRFIHKKETNSDKAAFYHEGLLEETQEEASSRRKDKQRQKLQNKISRI